MFTERKTSIILSSHLNKNKAKKEEIFHDYVKICIMFTQSLKLFWKIAHQENRLLSGFALHLQRKQRFVCPCMHQSDKTFTF